MRSTRSPDFSYEDQHSAPVAGVDEAGRGPWAGPVVAAAVVLDRTRSIDGLNDSKLLSPARRNRLYEEIYHDSAVGVGLATVAEIDALNIRQATHLAMRRAITALPLVPAVLLIDGNDAPAIDLPIVTLIKGDQLSCSIAAASIIAKVTRDRLMAQLHLEFPHYGWDRNQGYGTAMHRAALAIHGPCPHHRTSFAPIRALQYGEQSESA